MRKVAVGEARARLSEILNEVGYKGDRVVVHRRGKAFVVLLSFPDFKKLEALEDLIESRLLEETLRKGTFVSLKKAAKRLGLGVSA